MKKRGLEQRRSGGGAEGGGNSKGGKLRLVLHFGRGLRRFFGVIVEIGGIRLVLHNGHMGRLNLKNKFTFIRVTS